jgi:diguanylate cyclase (GGDEF)-like protein
MEKRLVERSVMASKPITPHRVHGQVTAEAPDRLGPQVLELTGTLQTTLEIDKLIELFARELRRRVELDGVLYEHGGAHVQIKIGDPALHRAGYDLVIGEERLGELSVFRLHPFTQAELSQLEDLLCALVYPLRNALVYRFAVERAFRDPLTGAQNRAAFDEALQRDVELARRQGTSVSVLVIDIDHFKQVNDTYGHRFGDDVLRAVAHAVGDTIRRSDVLYRYGGEEFVVLASHTTLTGARQLAERIRGNVAGIATVGGRELRVTVSVGAAQLRAGESAEALFVRADQALYRAKESGRNRVETAELEIKGSC